MIKRLLAWLLGGAALTIGGLVLFAGVNARIVERKVPPIGRFVRIGRNRIHFADRGRGPAILLIHGLGGQLRNFPAPLIDRLARRHRVVVMDRPGSGYSTRPFGAPAELTDQAALIAAFIRRLGLGAPLVVGHSLGGALALRLALDHPAQVGALALVAPLSQPVDKSPDAFRALAIRSRWMRLLVAWTLAVPGAIWGAPAALREVFGPDPVPADHGTVGGGLLGRRPAAFLGASADLVAAGDGMAALAARLASLRLPVGILYGDADQILSPVLHGDLTAATIPDATFETMSGSGHMVPIVQPEATADFIERIARRMAT